MDASSSRRSFLSQLAVAGSALTLPSFGRARDWSGKEPAHYPDADIVVLDDKFKPYKIGNTAIQRLHTGSLWAEGIAWSSVGRYLLWSDIPNNLQRRYLEEDGHTSVLRNNSGNSNGNTFDYQGRQLSCEHGNRRVVRYEHDGSITVVADKFEGKPLNAPNDIVVHPNGSIWFTDPGYGSMMNYEGHKGKLELKEAVYRVDGGTGRIDKVTDVQEKPNGLCFSPDYKKLYIVDTGTPKNIMVYDVVGEGALKGGREFVKMNRTLEDIAPDLMKKQAETHARRGAAKAPATAAVPQAYLDLLQEEYVIQTQINAVGAKYDKFLVSTTGGNGGSDGIRCDVDGNLWSAAGWVGDGYDGVHIFTPEGQLMGQIKLPEICANLCFGGEKRNRLFMAASTSIYSVYVETQGAHFC